MRASASSSLPPWEKWELDSNFFTALTRWTLENPEDTVDRILDRVCLAIEHGQEFFMLIPDGAFPARGLIQALAQLVKLGKVVKTAKSEVQTFAKEIIHWVNEIRSAFSRGRRKSGFTRATWDNLAGVRAIIEEICKWATSRLLDKRWSLVGIKNKLIIEKEITDFKARITEARAVFNERSIISQARGLDAILQGLRNILKKLKMMEKRQNHIELTINKIHATQSEHLKHLLDRLDADEAKDERRRYVLKMLSVHALENTSYVEQGKPPCDKGTRVDVLKEIMEWVQDVSPDSQNFLWLTGDPGCGKSAITASIARECKDKGFLWAQFFINRNDTNTINPNTYFPSIALQLIGRSGKVEHAVHDQLKAKPSIMDTMSPEQASSLFTGAIRVASQLDTQIPVVIVIDGLDETNRTRLKSTASIFSHLFGELRSYPNAKIFISSRTEDDIRSPFSRTMNDKHVRHMHLDVAAESSIKDVSMFLRRRIAQIVLDNELDWEIWPGEDRMDTLARRAAGLFIWAVTAIKFFEEQIETWGTECLDYLLDKLNSAGMGDINILYGMILSLTYKERGDEWAFQTFRRLVGVIVVLREPLCIEDIGKLLDLRRSSSSLPVDIIKFVKRLRTILVAGTGAIDGQTVPRLHKSFFEYITSHNRAEPLFFIDQATSHAELGFQCVRRLAQVRSAMAGIKMPPSFRYAFKFWSQHLTQGLGTESVSGIAIAHPSMNLSDLQHMFEHSSSNEGAPVFLSLSQDRSYIQTSLQTRTRSWNSSTGISLPSAFNIRATCTLSGNYGRPVSSPAFQPDGNSVVWASQNGFVYQWNTLSGRTHKAPFSGQNTSSIAFSQNHTRFVSGTRDGYIHIWKVGNLEPIRSFYRAHTGVSYIASSPTGHRHACIYTDGHLQFFTVEDDNTIVSRPVISLSTARGITFSPDGAIALIYKYDGSLHLWSWEDSRVTFVGQVKGVNAVAFSPDGKIAASASDDCTIRLWDTGSGEPIGLPLEGHAESVQSVNFSPGGELLVSGSDDKTVIIWNVKTGQPMGPPLRGHANPVDSVAFSPDGNHICAGSGEITLLVWASLDIIGGAPKSVSTSFSSNGERIATVFQNGLIQIWDAREGRHSEILLRHRPLYPRLITFSFDGSRMAAIASNSICMWDTNNGSLIASSEPSPDMFSVASLRFTPVGDQLVTTVGDAITTWREESGRIVTIAPSLEIPQPGDPFYFDITKEEQIFKQQALNFVRWLPFYAADSGLWAFMDRHIIRSRGDGSVTVVPVHLRTDLASSSKDIKGGFHDHPQMSLVKRYARSG